MTPKTRADAQIDMDIATSLAQHGASGLIVVNPHGGNYVLANVVQPGNADGPTASASSRATRIRTRAARPPASQAAATTTWMRGLETSMLLAAQPAYLRDGWDTADPVVADRRYLTTPGMQP